LNAHIFNVDDYTFPVHRDREFCGTGKRETPVQDYRDALAKARTFSGIITDLKGTRLNDLVFFYESRRGFHGVYQIISPPFFDPQDIYGVGEFGGHKVGADLPFRLAVRCVDYFPEPVPEDLVFSTPTYERIFWILFYRKIQGPRGCVTIDPEATRTLLELLIKVNGPPQEDHQFSPFYYDPEFEAFHVPFPTEQSSLRNDNGDELQGLQMLDFPLTPGEPVRLEDHLRGWLLSLLDTGHSDLKRIFGPASHIEWFANNVPYHVTRRNIDLLIYHRTPIGQLIDPPLRYRYSVVELKRDWADPEHVDQVIGYAKWVANRLADGEVDIVRPYIIARRFRQETIERAKSVRFNRAGIRLVSYEVIGEDQLALRESQFEQGRLF
jgi:hypothetical protein